MTPVAHMEIRVDRETNLADDRGATAIEYALIAALIAVSAMASMQGVGARIIATFMVAAEALGFGGVGGGGAPPIP